MSVGTVYLQSLFEGAPHMPARAVEIRGDLLDGRAAGGKMPARCGMFRGLRRDTRHLQGPDSDEDWVWADS
jgi:hypothetical protein